MNSLLNMILASIFSGGNGGMGNNMMSHMMPNQNSSMNFNGMGGNPLLNILMQAIGNGNPLMSMLMNNKGNGGFQFNNMNNENYNMNNYMKSQKSTDPSKNMNPNMNMDSINQLLSMFMNNSNMGNMSNMPNMNFTNHNNHNSHSSSHKKR